MFLKSLLIKYPDGKIIQDIPFHSGVNLIVDETPSSTGKETGNNVGKTTVLKLIDFCFGADPKKIYTDDENPKTEYKLVRDFLVDNGIIIELTLQQDINQPDPKEIHIEKNFLKKNARIQRFNGEDKTDEEFKEALTHILFPGHYGKKPTFKQIISHNIRYSDQSLNNTLKTLHPCTKDDEYETLYLFLLGCDFDQGDRKQGLRTQIAIEEKFKKRLESEQTKSAYESALAIIESEIKELEEKKLSLNINPNLEANLLELNDIKYQINMVTSEISKFELRKALIIEARDDILSKKSNINERELEAIYQQATSVLGELHKTFRELLNFHNKMINSQIEFIAKDILILDAELPGLKTKLKDLLNYEKELNNKIIQSDSFDTLEGFIVEINDKYRLKGEYENVIKQLQVVEDNLEKITKELAEIDEQLFSEDFAHKIQEQIDKFNRHFSAVSKELYNETYALKFDESIVKGRKLYKFDAFNMNFSSGKKQGEITCFDIAYILFADEENIPCMHFLLTDKKELMHDNQLLRIASLVNKKEIQFVIPILKDKLPPALNDDDIIILKLSQQAKLFKIPE
ncbi:MAG: DUF2326 domain-containing protein [Victivallaceae bacterium]|nr:DUF2326 domain-containing protein [Victivallaceae bacterium]